MTEWGDGTVVVNNAEEAQVIWKRVKTEEPKLTAACRPSESSHADMESDKSNWDPTDGNAIENQPISSSNAPSNNNGSSHERRPFCTVGTGFLAGFTLGVILSNHFVIRSK